MEIAHQDVFPASGDEFDSFVVDIERLPHVTDKDFSPNSRITLQRSFSCKGSHCRGERKDNNGVAKASSHDKATDITAANGDDSSKGVGGFSTGEKSITVLIGKPAAAAMNKQAQVMKTKSSEVRCNSISRRHRGKRPLVFLFGPNTVMIFFATLSTIGSILLIYFALSTGKLGEDELSVVQLQ